METKLLESAFSRTTGDFNDFDGTPLPNNRSTARPLFDDAPLPAQVRQYKLNKEPNLRDTVYSVQCTAYTCNVCCAHLIYWIVNFFLKFTVSSSCDLVRLNSFSDLWIWSCSSLSCALRFEDFSQASCLRVSRSEVLLKSSISVSLRRISKAWIVPFNFSVLFSADSKDSAAISLS